MKKQVLLLFAALLFSQAAFAFDFSAVAPSGQTLYYSYEQIDAVGTISVKIVAPYATYNDWSGYTMPTGNLVIPDNVIHNGNTLQVTGIEGYAFKGCSGLTSVTIPNTIFYISEGAFEQCPGLTAVHYNGTIEQWCGIDFYGDYSSFTNPLAYAHHLYINNAEVTSVSISNTITEIKPYTFYGCIGLISVTIGNSVSRIEKSAFYGCIGLTSVTIGNSVSRIEKSAFGGCSGLTSITFLCSIPPQLNGDDFYFPFYNVPSDIPVYIPSGRLAYYVSQIPYFTNYIEQTQGIGEVGGSDIHISISDGHINVEGVSEEEVRVYDLTGHMVQNRSLPSGVYMVKIGLSPARKVVVMN